MLASMSGKVKSLVKVFSSAAEALASDKSFAYFDLSLSQQDRSLLDRLKVDRHGTFDHYGDMGGFSSNATKFFESIGNEAASAAEAARVAGGIARKFLKASDAEAAWITIRASQPTDAFDLPRWHQDGYFWGPYEGSQKKFALALKGAGTLS